MTLCVITVKIDGEVRGLRQGRVVPLARATVHPHPSNAQASLDGYLAKCQRNGWPVPEICIKPWKEVNK